MVTLLLNYTPIFERDCMARTTVVSRNPKDTCYKDFKITCSRYANYYRLNNQHNQDSRGHVLFP